MILESRQYVDKLDNSNNYLQTNENEDLRDINSNISANIKDSFESPLKEMKIPTLYQGDFNPVECSPVHMLNKYSPHKSFRYNKILLQFEGQSLIPRKELKVNHTKTKSEDINEIKASYVSRRKLIRAGKLTNKHKSKKKKEQQTNEILNDEANEQLIVHKGDDLKKNDGKRK